MDFQTVSRKKGLDAFIIFIYFSNAILKGYIVFHHITIYLALILGRLMEFFLFCLSLFFFCHYKLDFYEHTYIKTLSTSWIISLQWTSGSGFIGQRK